MLIELNIIRQKKDDKIIEIFKINKSLFVNDPSRKIFWILWELRNRFSLADKLKLLSINQIKDGYIYVYEFPKDNQKIQEISLLEKIIIKYNPVLGKKFCNKCFNFRIKNNNYWCIIKNKQLQKNSYIKKCEYFLEK